MTDAADRSGAAAGDRSENTAGGAGVRDRPDAGREVSEPRRVRGTRGTPAERAERADARYATGENRAAVTPVDLDSTAARAVERARRGPRGTLALLAASAGLGAANLYYAQPLAARIADDFHTTASG